MNGWLTKGRGVTANGYLSSLELSFNLFIFSVCLAFISPDPPYISKAKNTGVSVGQKGILSCEASAVPMAEFQWFKEDTRYLEGTGGALTQS
jgi:hypothetical protein